MVGMLIAFIISLWFINSFKKGPFAKIAAVVVITIVIFTLSATLETRTFKLLGMSEDKSYIEAGVMMKKVDHNTPAHMLGLRKGDVIQKVGNNTIGGVNDLDANFNTYNNGDKVALQVLSKGEVKNYEATYDTQYGTRFSLVVFYGNNFKWILMGVILVIMAIFTVFLNSLNVSRSTVWLKRLQLVSSAAFSIGHGGNDAQKVMGIITVALIAYEGNEITSFDQMPVWVPLACYSAIALGTMSGGWKIIKTMGTRITKVTPFEGVAAETAGAVTLFLTAGLKIPVSSTHTITGSIIGVGATKRLSAVRWGVTLNLLWAWILTIPVSGVLAALVYYIFRIFL